jgi:hypothetical protein
LDGPLKSTEIQGNSPYLLVFLACHDWIGLKWGNIKTLKEGSRLKEGIFV